MSFNSQTLKVENGEGIKYSMSAIEKLLKLTHVDGKLWNDKLIDGETHALFYVNSVDYLVHSYSLHLTANDSRF